jgi:hypothetical protein
MIHPSRTFPTDGPGNGHPRPVPLPPLVIAATRRRRSSARPHSPRTNAIAFRYIRPNPPDPRRSFRPHRGDGNPDTRWRKA